MNTLIRQVDTALNDTNFSDRYTVTAQKFEYTC